MEITRRKFLSQSGQAASGVLLTGVAGAVIASCCGNPASGGSNLQTINVTAVSGVITLTVDSSSPLSAVGSAALVQHQSGALLVAHTGGSVFSALSAVCTHEACTVNGYSSSTQRFICPCHGSVFSITGQVVGGPSSYSSFFACNPVQHRSVNDYPVKIGKATGRTDHERRADAFENNYSQGVWVIVPVCEC